MAKPAYWIGSAYLLLCALALGAYLIVGSIGYAPLPLPFGAARNPIVVTIWHGTEKRAWLTAAAQQFNAGDPRIGGRPLRIELIGIDSREMALRAAHEEWRTTPPPTVVSPASRVWLDLLSAEWAARNRNARPIVADGTDAPQSLAYSPLVALIWSERAAVLLPDGSANMWRNLHAAIADPAGWQARGGRAEWGFVKLGHTSPLSSNSGTQALLLMAYGYYGTTSGLGPAQLTDPAFRQWLATIERAVLGFDENTGTLITNMVQYGPSRYDMVLVYEHLAIEYLEAARNRWGDLTLIYPPAT
ncbi:MAG TPA: substrate-binding domain-containing protein, partial [Roseiflexaceae bacterium]|nr:substrate-binding domain-containing protein [Roseiflexaceae bacterium]